jgi:anaerobic magnesium-protoporphyrin IX monomethyl ester cyclase
VKRLPVLPVETSRGCPFDCAYCSETTYWGKPVRYRSIDNVIEELRYNVTALGISVFRFTDSCFSAPPVRCAEFCDAIYERLIKRGLPIQWSSYARVNNLNEMLLGKMKMAGCVALDIGVESGSEIVLRAMGRHYAPEAAIEVARTARNMDIITNFNVVVGFPGETQGSMLESAVLINTAAPDTYSCFQFFLAPNTRVDTLQDRYHLEGRGLNWRHDTMTSAEAKEGISTIESRISNSVNFPGGEYFACYLASVGYGVNEIRDFYRSIDRLAGCPEDNAAQLVVAKAVDSIGRYW